MLRQGQAAAILPREMSVASPKRFPRTCSYVLGDGGSRKRFLHPPQRSEYDRGCAGAAGDVVGGREVVAGKVLKDSGDGFSQILRPKRRTALDRACPSCTFSAGFSKGTPPVHAQATFVQKPMTPDTPRSNGRSRLQDRVRLNSYNADRRKSVTGRARHRDLAGPEGSSRSCPAFDTIQLPGLPQLQPHNGALLVTVSAVCHTWRWRAMKTETQFATEKKKSIEHVDREGSGSYRKHEHSEVSALHHRRGSLRLAHTCAKGEFIMNRTLLAMLTLGALLTLSAASAFADGITGTDPEPKPPTQSGSTSQSSSGTTTQSTETIVIEQILAVLGIG